MPDPNRVEAHKRRPHSGKEKDNDPQGKVPHPSRKGTPTEEIKSPHRGLALIFLRNLLRKTVPTQEWTMPNMSETKILKNRKIAKSRMIAPNLPLTKCPSPKTPEENAFQFQVDLDLVVELPGKIRTCLTERWWMKKNS